MSTGTLALHRIQRILLRRMTKIGPVWVVQVLILNDGSMAMYATALSTRGHRGGCSGLLLLPGNSGTSALQGEPRR